MMNLEKLLERQAAWQRSRRTLTWAEKVRIAEQVRSSLDPLRAARSNRQAGRDLARGGTASPLLPARRG